MTRQHLNQAPSNTYSVVAVFRAVKASQITMLSLIQHHHISHLSGTMCGGAFYYCLHSRMK